MDKKELILKAEIRSMQKSLPLPLRRGVGRVKRQIFSHWLWDSIDLKKYFEFLQKSHRWSWDELKAYQLEQLKTLVKFAYEKVPYYQRSFKVKHLNDYNSRLQSTLSGFI